LMKNIIIALVVSCLAVACFGKITTNSIIAGYGYPVEQHYALTPDGYYLSLQRIPHGKNNRNITHKEVVFYQHGLCDASVGSVLNSPKESLPFILADAGYDVWLGNNRGNGYSMNNTRYSTNNAKFWEFTFDDMASADLPTNINYVLNKTGKASLHYIGHSEGTIQAFAALTENHALAKKMKIFIALAPVAYVFHTRSKILSVLADLDLEVILEVLGDHEFYLPNVIAKLLPDVCRLDPSLCDFDLNLLMGPSINLNQSRIAYYLGAEPNPTSILNIVHWAQLVEKNVFQKMDWGRTKNVEKYGQPTPPPYHLSNFPTTLDYALFTGSNDYLADPADVENLVSQLPKAPVMWHNEPSYAHVDFIWAPDAATKIYPLILSLLKKYD